MATYELNSSGRADGSIYITCDALPGFHFILWPGDKPETTLEPALTEFIARYEAARIRDR